MSLAVSHREHVSAPYLEKGYIHSYVFLHIHMATHNTHKSPRTDTRTPSFSPYTSSWGPREAQEGFPKQMGQARKMKGDRDRERDKDRVRGRGRGRVRKHCSGPQVTLLRSGHFRVAHAMCKVEVSKPKAAGPIYCCVTLGQSHSGWHLRMSAALPALNLPFSVVLTPHPGPAPISSHIPQCLQLPCRPQWSLGTVPPILDLPLNPGQNVQVSCHLCQARHPIPKAPPLPSTAAPKQRGKCGSDRRQYAPNTCL